MLRKKLLIFFKKYYPSIIFLIGAIFFIYFFLQNNNLKQADISYKIGFITDIHAHTSKKNNQDISPDIREVIFKFSSQMNKYFKPHFVIQTGDFIEGSFREGEPSKKDFIATKKYYDLVEAQKYHVMGNHDSKGLSKDEWSALTGNPQPYYSFTHQNLMGVVIDGNDTIEEKPIETQEGLKFYYISDKQFLWLEKTLSEASAKKMTIVAFMHYPLNEDVYDIGTNNEDDLYKTIFPDHAAKLRNLFENYGVLAVFSGHMEKVFYQKINNVSYFSLPGISKSSKDEYIFKWPGSFSEITIDKNNNVAVRVYYKSWFGYNHITVPSEEYSELYSESK